MSGVPRQSTGRCAIKPRSAGYFYVERPLRLVAYVASGSIAAIQLSSPGGGNRIGPSGSVYHRNEWPWLISTSQR